MSQKGNQTESKHYPIYVRRGLGDCSYIILKFSLPPLDFFFSPSLSFIPLYTPPPSFHIILHLAGTRTFCQSFIMKLIILFLLGLGWLTNAAYIPAMSTNVTGIESRDVSGFRSVAYFVNWVSTSTEVDAYCGSTGATNNIKTLLIMNPIRLSTDATSNLRICQPRSSPSMCFPQ